MSKATHIETGEMRAIKKIPRSKIRDWARFEAEVQILKNLDHPNVIKFYEYFEEENDVYLVTELCSGGQLFERILKEECFSEVMAARIFK